jgi:hypothetical protein
MDHACNPTPGVQALPKHKGIMSWIEIVTASRGCPYVEPSRLLEFDFEASTQGKLNNEQHEGWRGNEKHHSVNLRHVHRNATQGQQEGQQRISMVGRSQPGHPHSPAYFLTLTTSETNNEEFHSNLEVALQLCPPAGNSIASSTPQHAAPHPPASAAGARRHCDHGRAQAGGAGGGRGPSAAEVTLDFEAGAGAAAELLYVLHSLQWEPQPANPAFLSHTGASRSATGDEWGACT